ncbi:MarR family transcriptional regulator [Microbacteriaceae bacterium VKM Ac-2854]|nr:MarR family transcriptional regulator [Microbacteriaceae bacterium VKM Ac-2854]
MPIDHVGRIQEQWRRERPDLDVDPQGVIGRLHRLAGHLTAELVPVYARHGLGEGEFDVLATLRRAGAPFELAPSELAAHTMVTTGAMTKRLDRLVATGLVERRLAEDDGRRRIVALTAAGRERIDAAFAEHMANERRLVDQLDAADRRALEGILTRWLTHYEA